VRESGRAEPWLDNLLYILHLEATPQLLLLSAHSSVYSVLTDQTLLSMAHRYTNDFIQFAEMAENI
jgi:hypothetical protein